MKTIIKNFMKGNLQCIGWMLLYSGLEIAALIGLIAFYLKTDLGFCQKFLDLFQFTLDQSLSDVEYSLKMTEATMQLVDTITLPVIAISGIILSLVLAIKCKKTKTKVIKKLNMAEVTKYMLIGILLDLVVSFVIGMIPEELMETYNSSVSIVTTGNIVLTFIVAGVIAPISEEIMFRNFVYDSAKKAGVKYAILFSALSFGIAHGNIIQGAYAFLFGLIFAMEDTKKENLLPSIIMHITINSSSVLVGNYCSNEMDGLIIATCFIAAAYIIANRKTIDKYSDIIFAGA